MGDILEVVRGRVLICAFMYIWVPVGLYPCLNSDGMLTQTKKFVVMERILRTMTHGSSTQPESSRKDSAEKNSIQIRAKCYFMLLMAFKGSWYTAETLYREQKEKYKSNYTSKESSVLVARIKTSTICHTSSWHRSDTTAPE